MQTRRRKENGSSSKLWEIKAGLGKEGKNRMQVFEREERVVILYYTDQAGLICARRLAAASGYLKNNNQRTKEWIIM